MTRRAVVRLEVEAPPRYTSRLSAREARAAPYPFPRPMAPRKRLLATVLLAALAGACAPPLRTVGPFPVEAPGDGGSVRTGDQVALRIFREPEMSGAYLVAPDGTVTLPRLGVVPVAGRSVSSLRDSLRVSFARYLRNPSIDVTVLRRVGVSGGVRKPDLYTVDPTMTLRDVLAAAGGLTESANPTRITIIRDEQPLLLEADQMSRFRAAALRSGDQVVVAEKSWVQRNALAVVSTAALVVPTVIAIADRLKN